MQDQPWINGQKPPNEEWVEVISGFKGVAVAKAVYGRDGVLPHWLTADGTVCHPSRFNSWRRNPKIDQSSGQYLEYLLQNVSAGYVGNAPMFWAATGGYTSRIDDAKRWTKAEAEVVVERTRGSHQWALWAVDEVYKAAYLTVDIQDLRKLVEDGKEKAPQAD